MNTLTHKRNYARVQQDADIAVDLHAFTPLNTEMASGLIISCLAIITCITASRDSSEAACLDNPGKPRKYTLDKYYGCLDERVTPCVLPASLEYFLMDSFKNKFGEVFSPHDLVIKMIDLIPESFWNDSLLKWLDPGSGEGQFTLQIINKLQNNLTLQIPCKREREKHIIQNMVHMIEINPINVDNTIKNFAHFSHKPNIICDNFIDYTYTDISFDVIIGNPPFNFNGLRKVPTNNLKKKKDDGSTIWIDFIKKSLSLLKDNGFLCFITPSIWLRPDKQKIYHLLNQYQIHHIYCMTNTETNKLFKGAAQTPTVIFSLQKCKKFKETLIFDNNTQSFVQYNIQNNIHISMREDNGESIENVICQE